MPQTQLQLTESKLASVRQFPEGLYSPRRGLILRVATAADEAPAWWSKERDTYLRIFWAHEPFLASAIYSLCARNAAFRYDLTGSVEGAEHVRNVLRTAEFGEGWQELVLKVSEDLYCTDNGGFIEVIRPARARIDGKLYPALAQRDRASGDLDWYAILNKFGVKQRVNPNDVSDSPADWPIGLAHLDSMRCTRTGDPDTPVIYIDRNGMQHEMNAWQVVTLSDMPSPIEDMNGVGLCMVSRVLRHAQTIRDWAIYRSEKISGRFARAVHLTNVDADLISDAIEQAQARNDEYGLTRYSQPIITNTINPDGRPYNVTIPLAELPDNWSEDEAMRWYIALISLAAGEHYSFFAPMPGRRLGSAREVEVQERQARGKSSRLFMEAIINKFSNSGVFPPGVVFTFKERDPEEQAANEEAQLRRAQTRRERIESGEITPEVARQIAQDQGDLTEQYLTMFGEHDITPDEQIRQARTEGIAEPVKDDEWTQEAAAHGHPIVTESKQDNDPPEPWGDRPVPITVEDLARAIAKWNERLPDELQGLLQAPEATPDEEEDAEEDGEEAADKQEHDFPFGLGARYIDDPRDLPYSAAGAASAATLPLHVDNRVLFAHMPVWNQGKEGSCVGMVVAAAMGRLFGKTFSPRDAFERARVHDEWPGEEYNGSSVRGGCKAVHHEGCCEYHLRPWTPFDRSGPQPGVEENAGMYRITRYERLRTRDEMRHAIATRQHGFCLVTIDVHQGWLRPGPGYVIPYEPLYESKGTHAILLNGYDDDMGCWLVRNCWGDDWGDGGHAWLMYAAVDHIYDAWLPVREAASFR